MDNNFGASGSLSSRKVDKKKFVNTNEFENFHLTRSHSVSPAKGKQGRENWGAVRTRSMSPIPLTPLLNIQLPLKKFYSYSSKIVDQFEIVKIFISRTTMVGESIYEINRQRKRATEFAVRFSRNNLYQMKRFVNEIKQIVVPYPLDNLGRNDCDIICKKIMLAYQTATQALQTYINYMKSGQNLDVPEKIRELIRLIMDLILCCEHLSVHLSLAGDGIDILSSCKELMAILDDKIEEAKREKIPMQKNSRVKECENEDKRFSMYKMKLTNSNWKKKTEALAKIKFGSPKFSQIKKIRKRDTSKIYSQKVQDPKPGRKISKDAFEKNFKTPKQADTEQTIPMKKFHLTQREVTSQDDDIETIIQNIEDDDPMTCSLSLNANESSGDDFDDNRSNFRYKNNICNLVLQTIKEIQNSDKSDVKNFLKKLLKSLEIRPENRDEQPRNVKLIHIVSDEFTGGQTKDESISKKEQSEEAKHECQQPEAVKEEHILNVIPKERKLTNIFKSITESPSATGTNSSNKKSMNIKLPDKTADILIKYKKALNEYRKNNIMYKRGIPIRSFELLLRLSDQIINDVLCEMSSGMENENLLRQLYYNELLDAV